MRDDHHGTYVQRVALHFVGQGLELPLHFLEAILVRLFGLGEGQLSRHFNHRKEQQLSRRLSGPCRRRGKLHQGPAGHRLSVGDALWEDGEHAVWHVGAAGPWSGRDRSHLWNRIGILARGRGGEEGFRTISGERMVLFPEPVEQELGRRGVGISAYGSLQVPACSLEISVRALQNSEQSVRLGPPVVLVDGLAQAVVRGVGALVADMPRREPNPLVVRGRPGLDGGPLEHPVHELAERVEADGLQQHVHGPPPHGPDGAFDRAVRRDDDDREIRRLPTRPLQYLQPVEARHSEVKEHQVVLSVPDPIERLLSACGRVHLKTQVLQGLSEGEADVFFVVNDEDRLGIELGIRHVGKEIEARYAEALLKAVVGRIADRGGAGKVVPVVDSRLVAGAKREGRLVVALGLLKLALNLHENPQ